ncbi:MAG: HAMP domain-containing histidine kinase [Deltaproteobacteria bacterium]|nr:HAMP domain-containing histidine kinase [Deltaproteobacteria bacterium]
MPREKMDIMAQVAHDMGSPLTILLNVLHRLEHALGGQCDAKIGTYTKLAHHAIERLVALQDDLRQRATVHGTTRMVVDVAALIRDQLAAHRLACDLRQIALYYTGPATCAAWIDKAVLGRVLQNLLANAVQALPAENGHVWVHCAATDDGELQIDMVDNGTGIASAHLPRIFEKGFTHGKADGTGLGLHFCRSAVAAHQGTLSVSSDVGRGTCFHIRIPEVAVTIGEALTTVDDTTELALRLTASHDGRWRKAWKQLRSEYGPNITIFDPVAPIWQCEAPEVEGYHS